MLILLISLFSIGIKGIKADKLSFIPNSWNTVQVLVMSLPNEMCHIFNFLQGVGRDMQYTPQTMYNLLQISVIDHFSNLRISVQHSVNIAAVFEKLLLTTAFLCT